MRHKVVIDRAVAAELGVSQRKVSFITTEFIRQLREHLAEFETLSIEGLGSFRVARVDRPRISTLVTGNFKKGEKREERKVEIPSYIRVHFSKGPTLKALLDQHLENAMEKYGVDENVNQEQLEKKAAEGCPHCGKTPIRHGSVLICPEHGSEPFEADTKDT
jgi:nucleoid DNA-binding protein